MQTWVAETRLKALFKTVLVEGMEERRDLIRDAALEALEEIALVRAIEEGRNLGEASRQEVFQSFSA